MIKHWWNEYPSDYKLMWVLVIIFIIMVILAIGILSRNVNDPCWHVWTFTCKNAQMRECIASDLYTREECLVLIGRGK